jgi:hypothetical protein
MRALLALALLFGALSAWTPDASAARKSVRAYAPYSVPQRKLPRGDAACERRARADDPNGLFAGFPCWARSAFGQGRR